MTLPTATNDFTLCNSGTEKMQMVYNFGIHNIYILQYKTEYIRCTGFPVKHLAPEICVHLICILLQLKHLLYIVIKGYLNAVRMNFSG